MLLYHYTVLIIQLLIYIVKHSQKLWFRDMLYKINKLKINKLKLIISFNMSHIFSFYVHVGSFFV